eukprot:gene25589-34154_t
MSTLFADAHQASNYALHRPDYPDELFEKVYAYSLHTGGEGPRENTAVDLGTGTGQVALKLVEKYRKVIGFDTSEQQLEAARMTWASSEQSKLISSEIIFTKGNSENILLDDSSADLITVAQALHWFDLNLFYPEAHRVQRSSLVARRPSVPLSAVAGYMRSCGTKIGGSDDPAEKMLLRLREAFVVQAIIRKI